MKELPLRLERDKSGRPRAHWRAEVPESGHWLTEWLESDVADASTCEQMIEHSRSILDARTGSWRVSGNAYALLVGPRRALITPLFGPPGAKPFRVATGDLIGLLDRWKSHL